MIHLFINALAATAGGGLTYVRNVVPVLGARSHAQTTILVPSGLAKELPALPNVTVVKQDPPGMARRFWYEQTRLPGLLRQCGADVLISAGNFALWRSPVPQILLSRNALYTSVAFMRDLRTRGDYRLWIDTVVKRRLARMSIQHAECAVAPSAAFAAELSDWAGRKVVAIHHGFDRGRFFGGAESLPQPVEEKLKATEGCLRLLFVSHYNYYRNFETLIRALPLLQRRLAPHQVRLLLTCRLRSEDNPGTYQAGAAARLVQQCDVADSVVELGAVPYPTLHHLYGRCDVYVSPAYAESFAHPLVEAMASGLPVVASDLAVHREICGDAALYFAAFSPDELAERLAEVAGDSVLRQALGERGLSRSHDFSWSKHVDALLTLSGRIAV